jgi:hypothetical protein
VHGVADQQPGDSAAAVAGLLLQLGADGKPMTSAALPETTMASAASPAPTRDAVYPRFVS